jgi:hypothetical protein
MFRTKSVHTFAGVPLILGIAMQLKQAKKEEILHLAWRGKMGDFVCPTWARHIHQWETYDMHVAGCKICGVQHVCNLGLCNTERFDDGVVLCDITGLCMPCLHVASSEYSECVTYESNLQNRIGVQTKEEFDEQLMATIENFLMILIQSRESENAVREEKLRAAKKRQFVFNRVARKMKLQGRANMLDIFSVMLHETGCIREPRLLTEKARQEVCTQCKIHVFRLLKLMFAFKDVRGWKRSVTKTKALILGIVYMMRTGVKVNDMIVLPHFEILADILPHESFLFNAFGVRAKIITETENLVKLTIRAIPMKNILEHFSCLY